MQPNTGLQRSLAEQSLSRLHATHEPTRLQSFPPSLEHAAPADLGCGAVHAPSMHFVVWQSFGAGQSLSLMHCTHLSITHIFLSDGHIISCLPEPSALHTSSVLPTHIFESGTHTLHFLPA